MAQSWRKCYKSNNYYFILNSKQCMIIDIDSDRLLWIWWTFLLPWIRSPILQMLLGCFDALEFLSSVLDEIFSIKQFSWENVLNGSLFLHFVVYLSTKTDSCIKCIEWNECHSHLFSDGVKGSLLHALSNKMINDVNIFFRSLDATCYILIIMGCGIQNTPSDRAWRVGWDSPILN